MKNLDGKIFWIATQILSNVGTRKAHRIFKSFSHPKELFMLSQKDWESCEALSSGDRKKFNQIPSIISKAVSIYEKSIKKGITILTPDNENYPERLLNIYSPPLVLYAVGNIDVLSKKMLVGIVGTRNPDGYGIKACRFLAHELAEYGIPSVSGLAYGIDTVAHRRAVALNATTVAVLGSGLGRIYPGENERLAESIVECGGLIITEYPLDERPLRYNFPLRNRVISGISDAVVVVQGARGSGSLITAAHCISQNRILFAVPGNIFSELSAATNWLISQGAFVCSSVEDILYEFPHLTFDRNQKHTETKNISNVKASTLPKNLQNIGTQIIDNSATESAQMTLEPDVPAYLSSEQMKVFNILTKSGEYAEQIADSCEFTFFDTTAILTQLELLGLARELPGGLYVRV